MTTLDPSGDPRQALAQGWGVERPASVTSERIARRIELEPWSPHLVLGGIGSGKTTELWRVHQRLRDAASASGDATFYIDVAAETRLDALTPGALVALAGRCLVELEPRVRKARGDGPAPLELQRAAAEIRHLGRGFSILRGEHDDFEDREQATPGLLDPPKRPSELRVAMLIPHLRMLQQYIISADGCCVMLFDSLDRVTDVSQLVRVLHDDVRALRDAGIGVVLVGPQRLQYGVYPDLIDLFDQNIYPIAEVEPEGPGLEFLVEVLRRRAPPSLVSDDSCRLIAQASGGVLRDLIAIAKSSAQEAYVAASDCVTPEHVHLAIDQFGRVRAVGLDNEQIVMLKQTHERKDFIVRGERELALIETRRILDYGQGRFVVHPALVPVLDLITVAA